MTWVGFATDDHGDVSTGNPPGFVSTRDKASSGGETVAKVDARRAGLARQVERRMGDLAW